MHFNVTSASQAALKGQASVVELLVEAKVNASTEDVRQQTALHHACRHSYDEVARHLVKVTPSGALMQPWSSRRFMMPVLRGKLM